MKKLFMFVVFFVSMLIANAQPCTVKTIKNTTDEFSGEKIIETDFIGVGGVFLPDARYMLKRGLKSVAGLKSEPNGIYLWFQFHSLTCFTIPKGENFFIKLDDGTIIKLILTNNSLPEVDKYDHTTPFRNNMMFRLSGANLEQLKTKKINKIKCYLNEVEFKVNEQYKVDQPEDFKSFLNQIVSAK